MDEETVRFLGTACGLYFRSEVKKFKEHGGDKHCVSSPSHNFAFGFGIDEDPRRELIECFCRAFNNAKRFGDKLPKRFGVEYEKILLDVVVWIEVNERVLTDVFKSCLHCPEWAKTMSEEWKTYYFRQ